MAQTAFTFDPVATRVSFPKLEQEVLAFWREQGTFQASLALRAGGPTFSFYEGPPTANGHPGTHHVLARVFKDLFPRYKTMRGSFVPRIAGWDCHGLPVEIEVATGSLDVPGKSFALAVLVHRDNPLTRLTMAQLDAVYGAQREGGWQGMKWERGVARGPEKNIRTWGQLGLTGEWADKKITPYGSDVTISNWDDLVQKVAFHGGTKWNPAFVEAQRADISQKAKHTNADEKIIKGVLTDPYAIGFMFQRVINRMKADVKVIPIAEKPGGPYVMPGTQSFFDGTYAFRNGGYLYLNRKPGEPLSLREKEFVRFVLSREGQQILADDRQFIPLNAAQIRAELKKLE